jgi:hypothetical protein
MKGNAVTVKLDGNGTITTSAYRVELVASASARTAKKKPAKNAARKKD